MTENEAQKWLERFEWDDSEETSEALATICEALQEYPQFKAIGTIEKFKSLKEKSVAKKPIRSDLCTCPSCGTHNDIIKKRRNTVTFDTVYCWYCGQAIEIKCD